ncbi:MAG: YgfZ/GcvT domain-containing protein [Propionibacteriaceae bacterium]
MSRVVLLEGADAGAVSHYGDPYREQQALLAGEACCDLSHRDVVEISGVDRHSWLHAITAQRFDPMVTPASVDALILDHTGRIQHAFSGYDDGDKLLVATETGRGAALIAHLERMIFAARVSVRPRHDVAVTGTHAGLVMGDQIPQATAGIWAWEAIRIAAGKPRPFYDTDERTIPNEIDMWGAALEKGCYPGQETVARVYTLGRPPRRLVRLNLDGSEDRLPVVGAELVLEGKIVGRVGTSTRHYEDGPLALALVKRQVPVTAVLSVDGIPAAQEVLVDPGVGLHIRPKL